MKNLNLNTLQAAMAEQIEILGGEDMAIAACDRMYSASFRGEPVPLGTCPDWQEMVGDLTTDHAIALYAATTGHKAPVDDSPHWSEIEDNPGGCDCDDDDSFMYEMEHYQDLAETWMSKNQPGFKVDGNTLVVDICNYKGEGEGIALYHASKSLPIFRSKSESFNQVNY